MFTLGKMAENKIPKMATYTKIAECDAIIQWLYTSLQMRIQFKSISIRHSNIDSKITLIRA